MWSWNQRHEPLLGNANEKCTFSGPTPYIVDQKLCGGAQQAVFEQAPQGILRKLEFENHCPRPQPQGGAQFLVVMILDDFNFPFWFSQSSETCLINSLC